MKYTPTELFEKYKELFCSMKVFRGKLLFVLSFFAITFFMGFYTAKTNPEWTKEIVKLLMDSFAGLDTKSNSELWMYIFFNNISISTVIVVLFFLFGLAPIVALLSNGTMIGVVVAYSIEKLGGDNVFLAIVPHGIFELPAFFIAAALSLHLSSKFFAYLKKEKRTFKKDLLFAIKILFFIVAPLLFVAAIIETFITPKLIF